MAKMEAELEIDQGRAVVTLGGALDVSNAHRFGALLRRLVHEGCTEIVVDLATAASIDASGIGILRGAANAVRRRCDGRLHFRNAPIDLASILTDCGLVESRADEGETDAASATPAPAPKRTREVQPPSPRQPGRTTRSRVPRR